MSKSILGILAVTGLVSACLSTVGTSGSTGGAVAGDAAPGEAVEPGLEEGVGEAPGEGTGDAGKVIGDAGPTGPKSALASKAECEAYLECVNQSNPRAGGAAVALYGDDSPCWKGSGADAKRCADACRIERRSTNREGSKYPACGCNADAECTSGFCATKSGFCGGGETAAAYAQCKLAAPRIEAAAVGITNHPLSSGLSCLAVLDSDCEVLRTTTGPINKSVSECYSNFKLNTDSSTSLRVYEGPVTVGKPARCSNTHPIRYACFESDSAAGVKWFSR